MKFGSGRDRTLPVWLTDPFNWIKPAVYIVLLGGVYFSTLRWLITTDWSREDYSYSYLIPLIVLYLIWDKKDRLMEIPAESTWKGFLLFAIGLAFFWLGELAGEFLTLYFSLWLVLIGLCWMHLGWKKLKVISFALVMILPMFPLPHFLYDKVSFTLKLISSQLGVAMMQAYGMSAYREGNVIDLGFTQLQVVDACSGLRFLIPLIVLSVLLAYFFRAALWKKAFLVCSSIPLAIVTNSLRIALTGILYEIWGPKVAEGFFHGFSGWFIFMSSLVVLLAEMWILKRLPPRESPGSAPVRSGPESDSQIENVNRPGDQSEENLADHQLEKDKSLRSFYRPPQFLAAAILIGATLALSQGVEFREKVPITKPLDQFPLVIGEWTGARQGMEQKFIDSLDLSDYTIIDYKNNLGRQVNFYVAYYESQRKGESIHSPATCLPGSGWLFKQAGDVTLPIPDSHGDFMKVNRAFMAKGGFKQLSYYWFAQRGRVLTNAYQLKFYVFLDALTKQRTDGALVRIITPVYEFEEPEKAEARLQDFTRQLVPVLGEFIPGAKIKER